ncbi:MAG: NUDIX hydrolase [Brevinematales bacterium]|nr:NUDIX hydrolase [Brevinematales bacterium]
MEIVVIDSRLIYKGKSFSLYSDRIEYNGKEMTKDVVMYPEAVAILPMIEKHKFVLIKQYRYPVKEELLEVPAGKMEVNESVVEAAVRELEEETGYRARKVRKIYEYYPAVGYSSERIHVVVAEDLIETRKNLDEDEFTEVVILDYEQIMNMIRDNTIKDAKTILSFTILDKLGEIL